MPQEGEPEWINEDPTVGYDDYWKTEIDKLEKGYKNRKGELSRSDRIRMLQIREQVAQYKKEDHAYLNAQATRFEQWHLEQASNRLGESARVDILTQVTALRDAPTPEAALAAWGAAEVQMNEIMKLGPDQFRDEVSTAVAEEFYPTLISGYAQYLLRNGRDDDYAQLLKDISAGTLTLDFEGEPDEQETLDGTGLMDRVMTRVSGEKLRTVSMDNVLGRFDQAQRDELAQYVRAGVDQAAEDADNAATAASAAEMERVNEIYDRLPNWINAAMSDDEIVETAYANGIRGEQLAQIMEDVPALRAVQTAEAGDLGALRAEYGGEFDDLRVRAVYARNDNDITKTRAELDSSLEQTFYARRVDDEYVALWERIEDTPGEVTRSEITAYPPGVARPMLAAWQARSEELTNLEGFAPYEDAADPLERPDRYFTQEQLNSRIYQWTLRQARNELRQRALEQLRQRDSGDRVFDVNEAIRGNEAAVATFMDGLSALAGTTELSVDNIAIVLRATFRGDQEVMRLFDDLNKNPNWSGATARTWSDVWDRNMKLLKDAEDDTNIAEDIRATIGDRLDTAKRLKPIFQREIDALAQDVKGTTK